MLSVPFPAALLGGFGFVPFLALALASVFAPEPIAAHAAFALLAYGATILSFLGGALWGFAVRAVERPSAQALAVSVAPQLIGWAALLAPPRVGFVMLAAAIVLVLYADRAALRAGAAPGWWMRLRIPLSCAAGLCLAAGAWS